MVAKEYDDTASVMGALLEANHFMLLCRDLLRRGSTVRGAQVFCALGWRTCTVFVVLGGGALIGGQRIEDRVEMSLPVPRILLPQLSIRL